METCIESLGEVVDLVSKVALIAYLSQSLHKGFPVDGAMVRQDMIIPLTLIVVNMQSLQPLAHLPHSCRLIQLVQIAVASIPADTEDLIVTQRIHQLDQIVTGRRKAGRRI